MEFEKEPQRPTPLKRPTEKPPISPRAPSKPYETKPVKTMLPTKKTYAREVSVILGASLILIGLVGFVMDNFLGAHLSYAHNVIHVVSGALAVWFGFDSVSNAKKTSYIFGTIYGALGILGFIVGVRGMPSVGAIHEDRFLWRIVPEAFELGTVDHSLHIIFAAIFILGAALGFKKNQKV